MIFSSIEFLLFFLPVFLVIYFVTPKALKNFVLLLGSLVFYALGSPKYLSLLLISVLLNHLLINWMQKRKCCSKSIDFLYVSDIILNLGVLIICKYFWRELPLGISFYTFRLVSYLTDFWRGEIEAEKSFVRFSVYITMFPQMVSGPIAKYGEIRDRLYFRENTMEGFNRGMKLFTVGLAAKVLLADPIGMLWQEVQVTGFESISTALAWLGAAAYSLKIYFDFAGYSLMAMGLGKILGFELPRNFRHPYAALSVRGFYRRWHMTLGRWFAQYVYIPLGGKRKGFPRMVLNLLIVWLLTSIWHGETVNFILWGMLLWLFIVMEKCIGRLGAKRWLRYRTVRFMAHVWVPTVITVSWVCFAISDPAQLLIYLQRMFGLTEGIHVSTGDWMRAIEGYWYLFLIGGMACTPFWEKLYKRHRDNLLFSVLMAVLFWICVWRIRVEGNNPFMYSGF